MFSISVFTSRQRFFNRSFRPKNFPFATVLTLFLLMVLKDLRGFQDGFQGVFQNGFSATD
jgi:hypothetical protein